MPKKSALSVAKISPQFLARLNALRDDAAVQAIVLLQLPPGPTLVKRQSPAARADAIATTRHVAAQMLNDIDAVLAAHQGERISSAPILLGSLVIRANRAAILGLAALPTVKGIIEDQSIHPE